MGYGTPGIVESCISMTLSRIRDYVSAMAQWRAYLVSLGPATLKLNWTTYPAPTLDFSSKLETSDRKISDLSPQFENE